MTLDLIRRNQAPILAPMQQHAEEIFSIVIPCLNEVAAIDDVLTRLSNLQNHLISSSQLKDFEIIVVDDGSTDGSVAKIKKYSHVKLIEHPQTRGYGACLKEGFRVCQGDWIGFLDMDSTYDPRDLEPILHKARATEADIVFGVRSFWGPGMPWLRGFGNFLFSKIVRLLFGRGSDDIASGLRVFHRRQREQVLALPHNRFDFCFSLTIWALVHRWRIQQIPISYSERNGESKLHSLKDGLLFFRVVFELIRVRS